MKSLYPFLLLATILVAQGCATAVSSSARFPASIEEEDSEPFPKEKKGRASIDREYGRH
jgi:hypothetical protein